MSTDPTLAPPTTKPAYTVETYGELHPYLSYEWLLSNGLGGYASSSVVGCNTRRYHGLLCAATTPPVGRMLILNRVGEIITLDGKDDQLLEFSVNQFHQTFHPRGDQYLERFELDEVCRWFYDVEGVRVVKEVHAVWQKNIVGVRYTVDATEGRQFKLSLMPFVSLRDFHSLRSAQGTQFKVQSQDKYVIVSDGNTAAHVQSDAGVFEQKPNWWYAHTYYIEAERGMADSEDLFCPGSFVIQGKTKAQITLWSGVEKPGVLDWDAERSRHPKTGIGRRGNEKSRLVEAVSPVLHDEPRDETASNVVLRLARAAADFIVNRKEPDGTEGKTVIAGYHWFADWGRDTMISLPGLFLATRRFEEAGRVLCVFAHYTSQGMIPNRFDDYSNEPHYNTVDASLWFIHACHEYLRLSGDQKTFNEKLLPACKQIIEGYTHGTRYNIHVDPEDELVSAGDPNTQLTWMDAKMGDVAFTPRSGKPVEINALWYNALKLMGEDARAEKAATNFRNKFWLSPFRGCYDVIGDESNPNYKDAKLRPNQIFAASLPHSPLDPEQRRAVVEVVRRELLTPFGLRTLARGEPNYHPRYAGDQFQRDGAYHNGPVWPWLIGSFLEAYLRINDSSADSVRQARVWLRPLLDEMDRGCIGQLHEIFEGDEPHRPVGCCAQAWSVAEVLRMAVELEM
jgi:predicted glycogen debranching enzyme